MCISEVDMSTVTPILVTPTPTPTIINPAPANTPMSRLTRDRDGEMCPYRLCGRSPQRIILVIQTIPVPERDAVGMATKSKGFYFIFWAIDIN